MPPTTLPPNLLVNLIDHYRTTDTIAIVLSGSFARDEATSYSDLSIILYMRDKEACHPDYELHYHNQTLVSISRTTVSAKQKELESPDSAIWAVKGIQQSKILYDPNNEFKTLQQSAQNFEWQPLQSAANQYASENLRGLIEEAHKILTGLHTNDESTMFYATLGMILSLPRQIAVQRGLLMVTENEFAKRVQESVGLESEWTRIYRIAAGLVFPNSKLSPTQFRGLAALKLYTLTVELLRHSLSPEDSPVIDHALSIIHQSDFDFLEAS